MMKVTIGKLEIELPVGQGKVAETIQRLHDELDRVRREDDMICELVSKVQDECSHPGSFKSGDYSGDTYMKCPVCGKEH
jgi:hypothetical protein